MKDSHELQNCAVPADTLGDISDHSQPQAFPVEWAWIDGGRQEDFGELSGRLKHDVLSGVEAMHPATVGFRLVGDRSVSWRQRLHRVSARGMDVVVRRPMSSDPPSTAETCDDGDRHSRRPEDDAKTLSRG